MVNTDERQIAKTGAAYRQGHGIARAREFRGNEPASVVSNFIEGHLKVRVGFPLPLSRAKQTESAGAIAVHPVEAYGDIEWDMIRE